MMLLDPKRKATSLIVDGLSAVQAPTVDGVEQDAKPAMEAAAARVLSAIKADSASELAAAFKELMDCCAEPSDEPASAE